MAQTVYKVHRTQRAFNIPNILPQHETKAESHRLKTSTVKRYWQSLKANVPRIEVLRFKVNAVSALRCDLLRDVKIYARIYVKYKSSTAIKNILRVCYSF